MKTNYVIGETYFFYGKLLRLKIIEYDYRTYPLRCYDFDGKLYQFTFDGKFFDSEENPSLSISPNEFIAPKSKEEYGSDMVEQAITLLKSEGYTITKQY